MWTEPLASLIELSVPFFEYFQGKGKIRRGSFLPNPCLFTSNVNLPIPIDVTNSPFVPEQVKWRSSMRIPIQQAQITTTNDALFFCKNWNK
jgi:hypothetical protein